MKTTRNLIVRLLSAGFVLGALSGCNGDIVGQNLRTNFGSFLIGVFSDSVQTALQPD
ncbi:MAG: hypothetical protein BroJett003_05760 [Planctomycetota bacterium]|nr:MAG: hypothetical protein BroJett003_05760 [Planctomycetota bacterium]